MRVHSSKRKPERQRGWPGNAGDGRARCLRLSSNKALARQRVSTPLFDPACFDEHAGKMPQRNKPGRDRQNLLPYTAPVSLARRMPHDRAKEGNDKTKVKRVTRTSASALTVTESHQGDERKFITNLPSKTPPRSRERYMTPSSNEASTRSL